MIAIGIGCRKNCPAADIAALVRDSLKNIGPRSKPLGLFTIEDKREEQGLIEAAETLALPLSFLDRAMLAQAAPRVQTRSERVEALFSLPSIAEAAALAGAGEGSRLLLPRVCRGAATCAIAESIP